MFLFKLTARLFDAITRLTDVDCLFCLIRGARGSSPLRLEFRQNRFFYFFFIERDVIEDICVARAYGRAERMWAKREMKSDSQHMLASRPPKSALEHGRLAGLAVYSTSFHFLIRKSGTLRG